MTRELEIYLILMGVMVAPFVLGWALLQVRSLSKRRNKR